MFIRDDFTCQVCGLRPADIDIPDPYTGDGVVAAYVFGPRHLVTVIPPAATGLPPITLDKTLRTYFEVDHVVPISKGGTNDLDNLQCLCEPCNRAKSDRLP